MAMNRIRRRWTRRTIALLIVVNAALWASFVLAGRHPRGLSAGHGASRPPAASHP